MFATVIAIALSFSADSVAVSAPQPRPEPVQLASAPPLNNVAVTLECTAHADGHVSGCKVLQETHPGMGFGEAAIALMRDVEVAPGRRDVQFARTFQFVP